jgi:formyltetrahydrofolate hydrolase
VSDTLPCWAATTCCWSLLRDASVNQNALCRFRGAAPVQRALIGGVEETGVSVAYTVLRCDAGPVLAQEKVGVCGACSPNRQGQVLLRMMA